MKIPIFSSIFTYIGILLLAFSFPLHAQEESVWTFGANAGIDFNGNTPRAIKTGMATKEGSASISNAQGQLLFYTDGFIVRDRNHNIMPNGMDITTVGNITSSTTQGTIIVPMPGEQDKYYVFSLGQFDIRPPYSGRLYYGIIDMTLNNGLGDITTKGIIVDSLLTEHMTAVSGDNCDAWLIVVSRVNNDFKAYNINVNGIETQPVISPAAEQKTLSSAAEILGTIDISPDRGKLGIAQDKVIIYDFDPTFGQITHPLILDTFPQFNSQSSFYGLCFSPDNSKLYVSLSEVPFGMDPALYQFDLSSGDSLTMVNSKTLLSNNKVDALKRAPDGKVYGAAYSSASLHVINSPNIAGTGCQFVAKGFPLFEATYSFFGLPNLGTLSPAKKHSLTVDSVLCSEPRTLKAKSLSGQNYVWEDGTSGHTRTVNEAGVYWVHYRVPVNTPCKYEIHVDTFRVVFRFMSTNIYTLTKDSGMCKTDTLLLKATNLNGSAYTWNDDSTGMQRKVNQTGIYYVSYRVDSLCEYYRDSFIIHFPNPGYRVSFSVDTLVCNDDLISFQNTSDAHFNHFHWSFEDQHSSTLQNPEHAYAQAGSYRVMLVGHINDICPDTAYQTIVVDSAALNPFFIDKDKICTGESVTFYNSINNQTIKTLRWQFGDGNSMTTSNEAAITHAYTHAGRMPVTLVTTFRACPDTSFTHSLYVSDLPIVNIGTDSVICLKDIPIVLQNLYPNRDNDRYLWNTGDTLPQLKVFYPGNYSLTITNQHGCATTGWIKVEKDCYVDMPNAFTPNGDGINDYFFPRQLLSKSLTSFRLQIFNRWGQLLFETNKIDGRGWDGRFNGKEQPSDVYLYIIKTVLHNGRTEQHQGNITLVR